MSLKSIGILFLIHLVSAQNPSPCPQIFSYEPRGQEQDRWYGVISLQTKEDLDGVWLKIVLDRPAELLGNWFGEATSSDNKEFTVKNPHYKLEAGPPVSVRFFIKYNAASTIPSLHSIKLNGKTICSARREEIVTTTPQLHISQVSKPTNRPVGRPSNENAYVTQTTRPIYGTSSQENNYDSSSAERGSSTGFGLSSKDQSRPSSNSGNGFGSSSQNKPNRYNNNNHQTTTQDYSNGSRRSSSSSNNRQTNSHNTNQRDRETQTGTHHSNGLSVDKDSSSNSNGIDEVFLGDFSFTAANPIKTTVRPNSIAKRNVQCGTVAMKASPLISFGQNTTQGQWPWHAALYYAQGAQLMYTCGATLIDEIHILTAAHCVAKPQTNRPIDTRKLAVYLGKYSLKKFGSGTQDREVSRIYIHPQYNYSVYFNDIAVLKLKNPVDVTDYVRPCCLWEGDTDIENVINKHGTVVGWGFDENRQISDTLMQAEMPVVSTVQCIYSNREFFSQFTFEKNYCAGFRNGTTVCNGDSGGGMVFPKRGSSSRNPVWQIRGIVSVGVALQGQGVCDPSHYIVFTDVAKHLDWIRQVMDE